MKMRRITLLLLVVTNLAALPVLAKAQSLAREFIYGGPRSILSRMHRNHGHGAPKPDYNP